MPDNEMVTRDGEREDDESLSLEDKEKISKRLEEVSRKFNEITQREIATNNPLALSGTPDYYHAIKDFTKRRELVGVPRGNYNYAVHHMFDKTAEEIAFRLDITKRRVNQIQKEYSELSLQVATQTTPDEHFSKGLENYVKMDRAGWEAYFIAQKVMESDPERGVALELKALAEVRRAQEARDRLLQKTGRYQETKKVLNIYEIRDSDEWRQLNDGIIDYHEDLEMRMVKLSSWLIKKWGMSKEEVYFKFDELGLIDLSMKWVDFLEGRRLSKRPEDDPESLYNNREIIVDIVGKDTDESEVEVERFKKESVRDV